MSGKRIIVLTHEELVPPEAVDRETVETAEWKTEYDVMTELRKLGHEVRAVGVARDLTPIRDAIVDWKPHLAFNLLEEFHGVAVYDQHMAAYLELMRQPYTGCNPRGLMLAHDKVLSKKVLSYHRINVPDFVVVAKGRRFRRPKHLEFPLLVKSAVEDASFGIAQASVVTSDAKLADRVSYLHEQLSTDALVEEFVEGRELYVGVM